MQAGNALTWSVRQHDDGIRFRLDGELSRDTLLPLWKEWKAGGQRVFLSATGPAEHHVYWDLARLNRIDSAGFALLCELVADCRRKQRPGKMLALENVPAQLMTLADLFNLTDWLKPFIK